MPWPPVCASPRGAAVFADAAAALCRAVSRCRTGGFAATFEIIFLTGWAPHDSQQKPLRPGSAAQRLADALGAAEIPLPPATRATVDPGANAVMSARNA